MIPENVAALDRSLIETGFRVVASESWGVKPGIRQGRVYEGRGLSIAIAHDGLGWAITVMRAATTDPGCEHSVQSLAENLGTPLEDPFSFDDESNFLERRMDDIAQLMEGHNCGEWAARSAGKWRKREGWAKRIEPFVRAVFEGTQRAVRRPPVVVAKVAYVLYRDIENQSLNGDFRNADWESRLVGHTLEYLLMDLQQLEPSLAGDQDVAWSLWELKQRGWLVFHGREASFFRLRGDPPYGDHFALSPTGFRDIGRIIGAGKTNERISRLSAWLQTKPFPTQA